jgi:hypothetical protein
MVTKLQALWYYNSTTIIEITFLVRQMDSNNNQNAATAVVSKPNTHLTMIERPKNVFDSNIRKTPPGIFCGKNPKNVTNGTFEMI